MNVEEINFSGYMYPLFEKLAEWVGLSDNAAPVLQVLCLEKYGQDRTLSSDEICEATRYSRSNTSLLLSQLEDIGLVKSQRDFSQTGRGRKKFRYSLSSDAEGIFAIGFKKVLDCCRSLSTMINLIERNNDTTSEISNIISDLKGVIQKNKSKLESLPALQLIE